MTDRELLEAAAKAAGMETQWDQPRGAKTGVLRARYPGSGDAFPYWQPLDDDGAALRLAVALRLNIGFTRGLGRSYTNEFMQVAPSGYGHLAESGPIGTDPAATIRRAIVRAAAALSAA